MSFERKINWNLSMRDAKDAELDRLRTENDLLRELVRTFADFDHEVRYGTEIGGDAGAFIRAWNAVIERAEKALEKK